MRVIKLSDKDESMPNEEKMHEFFTQELNKKTPKGKFLSGKNIRMGGIDVGELLVFTYQTNVVYFACVASGVEEGSDGRYFCIDMSALKRCNDKALKEFGKRIGVKKPGKQDWSAIQGWSIVKGRDEEIEEILLKEYLHDTEINKKSNKSNKTGGGWHNNLDKEEVIRIEKSAVEEATKYYIRKEYKVKSVEKDNVGWDLEVFNKKKTLYVEVKGHKGDVIQFELTPNEYEQMQVQKKYRVCVVCQALDESPRLIELFPVLDDKWTLQTKDGKKIVELEERTAARVIRQQ